MRTYLNSFSLFILQAVGDEICNPCFLCHRKQIRGSSEASEILQLYELDERHFILSKVKTFCVYKSLLC